MEHNLHSPERESIDLRIGRAARDRKPSIGRDRQAHAGDVSLPHRLEKRRLTLIGQVSHFDEGQLDRREPA